MRNDTVLYEEQKEVRDHQTGEVTQTSNRKIVKKEKTPEFVMMFVAGVDAYTSANLSQAQSKTMAQLLKYTIKNSNLLMVNKATKEMIANDTGLKYSSVDQNIRALVKKDLLIKENGLFFLNPGIFGKGDFSEIAKLRHTFNIEYDFDELTAVSQVITSTRYHSDAEVLEPVDAKEEISNDGRHKKQTLVVKEKQRPSFVGSLSGQIGNINGKAVRARMHEERVTE